MRKSIKEYFSRIGKARGFGIQSPWAYSFVTEVIGERLPYYAYTEIDSAYTTRKERKYQKLLYRVRNFLYPHALYVVDDFSLFTDDMLSEKINEIGNKGAIIIRGIWNDEACLERWQHIQDRDDIGVTFDLYDFGICFLDREIFKQHYKLNF